MIISPTTAFHAIIKAQIGKKAKPQIIPVRINPRISIPERPLI
jgi:hypothetical protein